MTTVAFDSVVLRSPEPFYMRRPTLTKEVVLLSGKTSVQTSPQAGLSASFRCTTEDFGDFTAIIAKIGTTASLVIGTSTYTNCVISGAPTIVEKLPGVWEYEVSFVQDTS